MTQYYNSAKEKFYSIPKAPYYALSNDTFMSNWGGASGKINTCVVPCVSYEQAEKVMRYMESRKEQNYIRVSINKPRSKKHVLYSLVPEWIKRAEE